MAVIPSCWERDPVPEMPYPGKFAPLHFGKKQSWRFFSYQKKAVLSWINGLHIGGKKVLPRKPGSSPGEIANDVIYFNLTA